MTSEEINEAANALIAWFKSQDIDPEEGIQVMALAMCIASISLGKGLKGDVEQVNRATELVVTTFKDLLENPEKFHISH